MSKSITKRKLELLAGYSIDNAIQLHLDSIILYRAKRYSSAFYLSVIAMEEMAKAKKLEHYHFYYRSKPDHKFEQKFLLGLYNHFSKQRAFIGQDIEIYSPRYYEFVEAKKLDDKKLRSLYVGLERVKGKVNTKSRISRPTVVKCKDARQQISIFNDELKYLIDSCDKHEYFFFIPQMDYFLQVPRTKKIVRAWKHRSGIRSNKWIVHWNKRFPVLAKGK